MLSASKAFPQGTEITIPGFLEDGQDTDLKNVNSYVNDRIIFKEYYFEATLPASPLELDENDEFAELGKAMIEGMFNMSWTLDLPGDIVETNADTYTEGAATWYFDVESFDSDRKMMIRTKYVNWTAIYIAIGVLVVIVGLITFLIIRRKRQY